MFLIYIYIYIHIHILFSLKFKLFHTFSFGVRTLCVFCTLGLQIKICENMKVLESIQEDTSCISECKGRSCSEDTLFGPLIKCCVACMMMDMCNIARIDLKVARGLSECQGLLLFQGQVLLIMMFVERVMQEIEVVRVRNIF